MRRNQIWYGWKGQILIDELLDEGKYRAEIMHIGQ
jgi:hypothetical protein